MKKNYFFTAFLFILCGLSAHSQTGLWSALSSGTTNNFLGVAAPGSTIAYVSGASGDIRKTTNGGTSWVPQTTGTPENLNSVFFTDILTGYAVGDNGAAIRTTNGGTTWTPMSLSTTNTLKHVWFFDANTGFISGGVSGVSGSVFKTTDGGTTWAALPISAPGIISSSYFYSLTRGYAACITGTVYRTNDGGTTWSGVSSGSSSLQSIQFTSLTDGIVTSQTGSIERSTTSGASWSPVTSGTTDALTGMDFYDISNGVIVGGNIGLDTGIILTTSNSGATWNTTVAPSSNRLLKVSFYDANTGYAVGLSGTILKWSVPPPPSAPDASFSSSAPGCVSQTLNFYSVMAGIAGVSHSWNFGSGATPASSSSVNPAGVAYSSSGAKIVTHIVTTALGSDTVTNIVTINPSPLASFSSTAPVCQGAPVNFSNTGTTGPGVTYSWDFGAGSSPINSTSQFPGGVVYSTSGIKNVTITVTNQFGCSTSTLQTISINPGPPANAGMDTIVCPAGSVQIGSATLPGVVYSWSPSSSLSNPTVSNPVASPTASSTVYTVTVTNISTGCVSQDATTITVIAPVIANAGPDDELCKGDSIQIGIGAIAGQQYMWSPSMGLDDTTSANPHASPAVTTTYTMTVSGNGCGSSSDEITVVVNPKPIADAGPNDTIPVGTSVQFNASGGSQYSWSPVTALDNPTIYNPVANPVVNTYYTVTVTNVYGCKSSDNLEVLVFNSNFWVPTAFTPDGNGIDDIFYVRGEGIKDLEFTVFNRWGEQIFLSRDLNVGWDGTRQTTGEKLPEGAYVYQVKGINPDGTQLLSKGMINLIR